MEQEKKRTTKPTQTQAPPLHTRKGHGHVHACFAKALFVSGEVPPPTPQQFLIGFFTVDLTQSTVLEGSIAWWGEIPLPTPQNERSLILHTRLNDCACRGGGALNLQIAVAFAGLIIGAAREAAALPLNRLLRAARPRTAGTTTSFQFQTFPRSTRTRLSASIQH